MESDVMNNATDDIRNDLAAALSGEQEVQDSSVADSIAEAATQVEEREQRARDEQGRFAEKQAEAAEQAAQPVSEAAPVTPPVEQQPTRKAPQSWKPDERAFFDQLPPEAQEVILRRESDFNKGIQKYAEDAKFAQSLKPAVEQWAPYLAQINVPPDQAFQHLISHEYVLRTGSPAQKQAKLMELAQAYGIDLGQMGEQTQQNQLDPNVQHALSRVQQLEAYIRTTEYEKQQELARQQQAEQATLSEQIQAFASSADAPHFEDVREDMAQLLKAGYATDLKDAYEKACWARPDIRASLLKAEEAKRIQEKAELAKKAQQKAVSVTGSPSGAAVPIAGASIRDDLMSAMSGGDRL
jgi:hypothetical protein